MWGSGMEGEVCGCDRWGGMRCWGEMFLCVRCSDQWVTYKTGFTYI